MSALTLYHGPGACSRVPLILLEQAGARYELRILRLAAGDNKAGDFLRLNPKGKVPVLVQDGQALTDNVAIALYLAQLFPQARLLPAPQDAWAHAQAVSWLSWCASGLHPAIFRARMAARVVDGEAAQASVKAKALAELQSQLRVADERLRLQPWLAAPHFTAADAYLFWSAGRAGESGLDLSGLPALREHQARVAEMPAVVRALAREG